MHDLVVMSPFGGYRIAQRITDSAAIAAIEADPHKIAKCRRVFAEAKPDVAAAPPVEAKASAKSSAKTGTDASADQA